MELIDEIRKSYLKVKTNLRIMVGKNHMHCILLGGRHVEIQKLYIKLRAEELVVAPIPNSIRGIYTHKVSLTPHELRVVAAAVGMAAEMVDEAKENQ